jgi:hypothetical protein
LFLCSMGYALTRSFPYAAAAVLAARRYARPGPKWQARRAVRAATRLRASRSRTVTKRKRRVRAKAGSGYGKRRRSKFNMNPIGSRILRFKNVTEVYWTWKLDATNPTTTPKRVQAMHTNWMSLPGTNDVQEAVFDNYLYKQLTKFSWRISNLRVFMETSTTTKSISLSGTPAETAPAATDIQVQELPDWVFWYWRMLVSGNTTNPPADHESRFTKFCKKDCHSAIRGYVPIDTRRSTWISGTYNDTFKEGGSLRNLDTYQSSTLNTSYGIAESATTVCSPDIYVMPDDPFPSSFYPKPGGSVSRTVEITVMADIYTYSTWRLKSPKV